MANTSILAAFERFWQHVVAKVGEKADLDHTHDGRYYTETEVDTKLSGKANTSHTHTKSEVGLGNIESEISAIENVASNANAKAGTAQDTADEAYALAESKADANHTHAEAAQDSAGLMSANDKIKLDYGGPAIVTTSGTGAAYTATVAGMNELKAGMSFVMIPHTVSTATAPTLNVNSLGAKAIRRRVTNATTTTSTGYNASWLSANKPIRVEYDGSFWIADLPKPAAADMSGTLPVANGGTGATSESVARTNLNVYSKTETDSAIANAIGNAIAASY